MAAIYAVWWWFLRRHRTAARHAAKESPANEREPPVICSFCGKSQDQVRKIIAGPKVYICDECIELASDIIAEEGDEESPLSQGPPPWDPSEEELRELERIGKEIGEGKPWVVPVIEGKLAFSEARPLVGEIVRPRQGRPDLTLTCSFCSKAQEEVAKLIAGPTTYICNECVRRFSETLAGRERP